MVEPAGRAEVRLANRIGAATHDRVERRCKDPRSAMSPSTTDNTEEEWQDSRVCRSLDLLIPAAVAGISLTAWPGQLGSKSTQSFVPAADDDTVQAILRCSGGERWGVHFGWVRPKSGSGHQRGGAMVAGGRAGERVRVSVPVGPLGQT